MTLNTVVLTGKNLTIEEVNAVARKYTSVRIAPEALRRCQRGYQILKEKIDQKIKIYGVTTGFGNQCFFLDNRIGYRQIFLNLSKQFLIRI